MVKLLLTGFSGDSGCQVDALGLHEKLLEIISANELVYAPTLVDAKEIPDEVDVSIIEGCIRTEHKAFILSGRGVVIGEDGEEEISPGDVVFVPQDEEHQFRNTGEEELKFLCLIPHHEK